MDLKQYQKRCLETAIYPNIGNNPLYPFLGLCGEFSEFYEIELTGYHEDVKKELGDVFWYFSILCYELKIDLTKIIGNQNIAVIFKGLDTIFKDIGKLSELFKKQIRDNNEIPLLNFELILFDIYINLFYYIDYRGWTVFEIMDMNISKLQKRKERNTLHGNGDNR